MTTRLSLRAAALAAVVLLPAAAGATDGYFADGYGIPYKGMAGAGVALRLNALAPATNPAALAGLGDRCDLELALFNPNRDYTVLGVPSGFPGTFGLAPGTVKSDSRYFPVPSLGANWTFGEANALGLAVYGNGGMNTDYRAPTFGTSPTGVDLMQVFVAPTYARRIGGSHSVGVSAILAYQRFRAQGLQAFAPFSTDALHVSDRSHDGSVGYGARLGYLGDWGRLLSVGASYQTRIRMTELKEYAGLFARHGGFDIPASWTVGIAAKPTENVDIAVDVRRVDYSSVGSVGNPMLPNLGQARLGEAGGAGFGWRDMTIYKAGVQWRARDGWTWRAGYSYGEQPIPSAEVLFNILAPGVMEQHATVGLTKDLGQHRALHLSITRAFSKSVMGANPLEAPGQQDIRLRMDQWEAGVGYSFGF
jgi:long-chain fatty acid transport protein